MAELKNVLGLNHCFCFEEEQKEQIYGYYEIMQLKVNYSISKNPFTHTDQKPSGPNLDFCFGSRTH